MDLEKSTCVRSKKQYLSRPTFVPKLDLSILDAPASREKPKKFMKKGKMKISQETKSKAGSCLVRKSKKKKTTENDGDLVAGETKYETPLKIASRKQVQSDIHDKSENIAKSKTSHIRVPRCKDSKESEGCSPATIPFSRTKDPKNNRSKCQKAGRIYKPTTSNERKRKTTKASDLMKTKCILAYSSTTAIPKSSVSKTRKSKPRLVMKGKSQRFGKRIVLSNGSLVKGSKINKSPTKSLDHLESYAGDISLKSYFAENLPRRRTKSFQSRKEMNKSKNVTAVTGLKKSKCELKTNNDKLRHQNERFAYGQKKPSNRIRKFSAGDARIRNKKCSDLPQVQDDFIQTLVTFLPMKYRKEFVCNFVKRYGEVICKINSKEDKMGVEKRNKSQWISKPYQISSTAENSVSDESVERSTSKLIESMLNDIKHILDRADSPKVKHKSFPLQHLRSNSSGSVQSSDKFVTSPVVSNFEDDASETPIRTVAVHQITHSVSLSDLNYLECMNKSQNCSLMEQDGTSSTYQRQEVSTSKENVCNKNMFSSVEVRGQVPDSDSPGNAGLSSISKIFESLGIEKIRPVHTHRPLPSHRRKNICLTGASSAPTCSKSDEYVQVSKDAQLRDSQVTCLCDFPNSLGLVFDELDLTSRENNVITRPKHDQSDADINSGNINVFSCNGKPVRQIIRDFLHASFCCGFDPKLKREGTHNS